MRLIIVGDSFADNSRINKKSGYVTEEQLPLLWTEQLKLQLHPDQYYNFGTCATGSSVAIQHVRDMQVQSSDILIAILSVHDSDDHIFENLGYQEEIHSLPAHTIVMHVDYDERLAHPYTLPLSLMDISWNEIRASYDEIKTRRWDKRVNHLSWVNHINLQESVLSMLGSNNEIGYDDFEFKIITLDEAYHPDLYDTRTFIYD